MVQTTSIITQNEQWPQHGAPFERRQQWAPLEARAPRGGLQWPAEAPDLVWARAERALPEDLRQAARGEVTLHAAFHTLAHHQEEQAHTAADLLERETWAVTVLLAMSGPIWSHVGSPTLRFALDRSAEPVPYHLELGHFCHLAALITPSAGERDLIAATTPCWARVYAHQERQRAGQSGVLACSYEPISIAEAVAALGLERILTQIEAATRKAAHVLLTQAYTHGERQARVLGVERMLGWDPEATQAPRDRAVAARTRPVLLLLGQGVRGPLAMGTALVGFMVILVCLLFGFPQAALALTLGGAGLMIWSRSRAI